MDKRKAMENLLGALVETGAEFSVQDGVVTVGGIEFKCGERCVVVRMGPATNYFRYETLCYITGKGNELTIADSHVGVFGVYEVR